MYWTQDATGTATSKYAFTEIINLTTPLCAQPSASSEIERQRDRECDNVLPDQGCRTPQRMRER
jgi:hypothetical protein